MPAVVQQEQIPLLTLVPTLSPPAACPTPHCVPLLQWATFPLLQVVFQIGDWQALLDNRTVGATLHGASNVERATGGWAGWAGWCWGVR